MEWFNDFLHTFLGSDPRAGLFVILNLVLIESLLSVDNAAVLATMVMDLPEKQRGKALKYGIIGAYVFRGLALLFASWLVEIWWLKPVGGAYLVYLSLNYFRTKATPQTDDDTLNKSGSVLYKYTLGLFGQFWATVFLVEVMDMAFSIDNVLAAVAYTDNIYLICTGVFIGILAMRFVAQGFVNLMKKFVFLGTAAFLVVGILGLKLMISLYTHYYPKEAFSLMIESHETDFWFSIITVGIFFVPVLTSVLFNYPGRKG
ncbi:MAG: TerC family protein [Bacteroidia bacterium]|nr:TerC family protein [Bacteroidia bacterium]